MIGMPLPGGFAISAKGDPVLFFGAQLPHLIGRDKALYDTLKAIHETIGTIGYYLIGLHAAAALFHHYGVRDNTRVRMLAAAKPMNVRQVLRKRVAGLSMGDVNSFCCSVYYPFLSLQYCG